MSGKTAFFVKDVIGPKGCVSIVAKDAGGKGKSASIEAHIKTRNQSVCIMRILNKEDEFVKTPDEWIDMQDEPDHQECTQQGTTLSFKKSINENIDLTDHMDDAVNSLRIAFACDESSKNEEYSFIITTATMITGALSQLHVYKSIHTNLAKAIDHVLQADFINMPAGKYEIEGDEIFYMVNEYTTKSPAECEPERHQKYTDIRIMINGERNSDIHLLNNNNHPPIFYRIMMWRFILFRNHILII